MARIILFMQLLHLLAHLLLLGRRAVFVPGKKKSLIKALTESHLRKQEFQGPVSTMAGRCSVRRAGWRVALHPRSRGRK